MYPTWPPEQLCARPSIAPLSEPQWGLPLTDPPHPYFLDYNRSRSDGRELSTPSTSRTPAASRGEQSINLLADLDAPLAHAPSRQIPSPRNLWRTGHTRLANHEPTSLVNKQLSDLWKILTPEGHSISANLSGGKSLLLPSGAWSQENLQDWIPSSQSLYSTPGRLSNLGSATSSIPACAN